MSPTFQENDHVLVSNLPLVWSAPKVGDIVVFEKEDKMYVKRIGEIKSKKFFLVGDNPVDSLDSRKFGLINSSKIKGKVIAKI